MKTGLSISGTILKFYSPEEQAETWKELSKDVSPIGKNIELKTPRDERSYYILSEKEVSFEKYEAEIKATGKIFNVKYNVCNQHEKIYKAVRKAYGY